MHVDVRPARPPDSIHGRDEGWPASPAGRPFAQVLGETDAASARPLGRAALDRGPPAAGPAGLGLAQALAGVTDGGRAVDALLAAAARGRTFTPAQLLALQAAVSRGAQAIEVVSRAADRLVGTMKQALGTQL